MIEPPRRRCGRFPLYLIRERLYYARLLVIHITKIYSLYAKLKY
nr:MAG TPA: hypothetical protein [Crassvirales sp.]